jgi:hypothetical protein
MPGICGICHKRIADDEPHFSQGLAWLHVECYEKQKPQSPPERRRPHNQ